MTFTKRTDWKDDIAGGTPVMAADMLRIEQGIADAQNPTLATVATSGAYNDLTGKPTVVQLGGDLGGTSANPTVISGANHTHQAAQIGDSTAIGQAVLTAADGATARTAIGAGTSSLVIGTTSTTAKAGDYAPASVNISDATATGRSLLTAADAATARSITGAVSQTDFNTALASTFRVTRTTDSANKTDATLASDTILKFDVTSDMVGKWLSVLIIPVWNLATGGGTVTNLQMQWAGLPVGTTGYWQSTRIGWDQPGSGGASTGLLAGIASNITMKLAEGNQGTIARALINPGATGTITLQWAQNTANAAALVCKAGSSLAIEVIS